VYAVVRRYEGVDESRLDELIRRADKALLPRLGEIAGFGGYYLVQSGGIVVSIGLFETPGGAAESTRVATEWIRAEGFGEAIPNPPEVTAGEVVLHRTARAPSA
jgi:hypothetical protein